MTDATTPEQPLDGVMLGAIRYRAGEGHGQSVEDRAWLLRYIERRAIEAQARPAVASEGLRAALLNGRAIHGPNCRATTPIDDLCTCDLTPALRAYESEG